MSEEERALEDFRSRQKRIYDNKVEHGFNITDLVKETEFISRELEELKEAIKLKDHGLAIEETADIVIFCYGLAEILGRGLDEAVFRKMLVNEQRKYIELDGEYIKM